MRPLPIALAASLALLAGCATPRAEQAPAAAATVQPPVDLLGTWTDRAGGGFIAIGARQIVLAVDGAARSVSPLSENAIEPGMGAGRLGLADGTALYVARGSTLVDGVPVDHLDIEVVRANAPAVRRRLLSESGLRLAARMGTPAPAPVATPLPVPAAAAPTPDAMFVASVPASRREAAEALVASASAGAPPAAVAGAFAERQRSTFAAILVLLDQARALPAEQAAARLQEADRRRADAEGFSSAWRAWMAGRG